MTIVAGFKCKGGVVLCADTLEATDESKWHVRKLVPYNQEWCQAVFGGSGNGNIVDMVTDRIEEELAKGYDNLKDVKAAIREALRDVYRNNIKEHPWPAKHKVVDLLIAVRPKAEQEVTLLRSTGPVLHVVKDGYDIVGVGEVVRYVASSLYKTDLPINRGVLLGAQLVGLAKKHVKDVSGETTVVILTSDGRLAAERVMDSSSNEEFFRSLNEAVGTLMLSIPDLTLSKLELHAHLDKFVTYCKEIRDRYAAYVLQAELHRSHSDPTYLGDVYLKYNVWGIYTMDAKAIEELQAPAESGLLDEEGNPMADKLIASVRIDVYSDQRVTHGCHYYSDGSHVGNAEFESLSYENIKAKYGAEAPAGHPLAIDAIIEDEGAANEE